MYAIILCGGSGTRLWPFSRSNKPKQFLKFDSSLTLFQKTIKRVSQLVAKDKIYIVTNVEYYYEVKGQLTDINYDAIENIICEPIAKNTLPAITYAVNEIEKKCKTAVIGTFSSDHEIESPNKFREIFDRAVLFAKKNYLVIFGIEPTEPNCGFGYIKPGEKVSSEFDNLFIVDKFTEKPNLADAENFIRDGYFWNSGMFVFTASYFIRLIKEYQPSVYNIFQNENSTSLGAIFSGSDQGNLSYIKDMTKKFNLEKKVIFTGFVSNEEIKDLYLQSFALVMPTYFGPTNMPPLEAFKLNVPVMYPDLPGLKDQVSDAALLLDLNEPHSLVLNLKKLLNSNELRNSLINKGKERYNEIVSNNNNYNVLKKIINDFKSRRDCWK